MPDRPCTHSELIARVVALEAGFAAFKELMAERDERYKQRALSQDAAVEVALANSERAINKAEVSTEKRFDAVNEFRGTLADQATKLMPRAEYDVQHRALAEKVEINEGRITTMQREISGILAHGGGLRDAWGYLVAVIGLIIAALAIYFHNAPLGH